MQIATLGKSSRRPTPALTNISYRSLLSEHSTAGKGTAVNTNLESQTFQQLAKLEERYAGAKTDSERSYYLSNMTGVISALQAFIQTKLDYEEECKHEENQARRVLASTQDVHA